MNISLSFVELAVRDLDAAIAWYREVLGLHEVMRDDAHSFVLLGAGSTRLALKRGTPSPGGVLLAFEVADLAGWVHGLADKGVPIRDGLEVSPEGYRRVRILDADGYAVSVFEWVNEKREGVDAGASSPSP